jgi:hypothetical protein
MHPRLHANAGGSTEKRLSRMEQRKALSAGRTDAPVQYIEARHAQVSGTWLVHAEVNGARLPYSEQ